MKTQKQQQREISLSRRTWRTVSTNVGILGWAYGGYLAAVYWLLPALMGLDVAIPVWIDMTQ